MVRMTAFEASTVALGVLSIVLIPLMAILIRLVIKGTRFEAKLEQSLAALSRHVADSDKVHAELAATLREDRKATDERLRWLERNVWQRQARGGNG